MWSAKAQLSLFLAEAKLRRRSQGVSPWQNYMNALSSGRGPRPEAFVT
jgi:hypothetical protein